MFETTLHSKPKSKYRHLLAGGSVIIHLIAGCAFLVLSLWEIDELRRPSRGIAMGNPLAMPAPQGGSAKAEPKRLDRPEPKVKKVKDRQPSDTKPEKASTAEKSGDDSGGNGIGIGTGPGEGEGPAGPGTGLGIGLDICLDPDLCAPPPVPVAAEVETPEHVPAAVLGTLRRTAGEAQIQPPSATKNAMSRTGKDSIKAILLMCLDKSGAVTRKQIVRSSGYADYDAKLRSGVARWRYEPYRANGKPAAICTQLTFVYHQE